VAGADDPKFSALVYEILAERYLDSDKILPLCRVAWSDAFRGNGTETFLRTAVEKTKNVNVRGLCCYSLGRHQHELAVIARDLNDPVRGPIMEKNLEHFGSLLPRFRAANADQLDREAEDYFERTIKEFGNLQPLGTAFAPLGEQAKGMLFQIKNLSVGRVAPEIVGEDVDGKTMKLSDFRGKVVVLSFWATWCGPCMGLVPHEKALKAKMKGRPFALIGVNGDDDREKTKSVSAEKGIDWRSFWTGGRQRGIPVEWGIGGWPTVYIIDADGVIRDEGVVYFQQTFRSNHPDQFIESLVLDAEQAAKR
jgi:thiol-disulfide isomerase/thioredoxin